MSAAVGSSQAVADPPPSAPTGAGYDRLPALARASATPGRFIRAAVAEIASHFGSPLVSVSARMGARTLRDTVEGEGAVSAWRDVSSQMLLTAEAEGRAIGRLYEVRDSRRRLAVVACPFRGADLSGALALCVWAQDADDLPAHLAELRSLATLMAHLSGSIAAAAPGPSSDGPAEAIAKTASYRSVEEFAFSVTNSLRTRFACEQVIFGVPRNAGVRILSISGLDEVKPRSPGTQSIRQAMEECLDASRVIEFQIEEGWDEEGGRGPARPSFRLHRQWHESTGGAALLSIPLMAGDRVVAVVSFRRRAAQPFSAGDVQSIRALVEPYSAALELLQRATRGPARVAYDRARQAASFGRTGRGIRKALTVVAIGAGAAWFAFGSIEYRVSAPAVVRPGERRHIGAPFDGAIASASVRAGDPVRRGDTLCSFDTRAQTLEAEGLNADARVLRMELERALDAGRIDEASLLDARLGALEARRARVDDQIRQGTVRAPFDGTVVRGDLSERVGEVVALGETLFELAPAGDWCVEVRVPEHAADEVEAGATGSFMWGSRPGERVSLSVERVTPTAEPINGRNVFVVRGGLSAAPAWLRPGMEGHAAISAGRRPVWWVVLHRAIDAVRAEFWL